VKTVRLGLDLFNDDLRRVLRLDLVHIDRMVVYFVQRGINVFQFAFVRMKKAVVADHMQDNLGHPAWFAVLGPLEHDVFHFTAAQGFSALFTQHP
jgi:hypothetical protein